MRPRSVFRYPKHSSETYRLLNLLEDELKKMGSHQDPHRRAKVWLHVTQDINMFLDLTEKKIKIEKELLEQATNFVKKVQHSTQLNFLQRNLKTIKAWMSEKRLPKI